MPHRRLDSQPGFIPRHGCVPEIRPHVPDLLTPSCHVILPRAPQEFAGRVEGCLRMPWQPDKIVMDVDTFLRAYEAAAPARRTSFIILRTKHDGDMVEGFPSGMLQMSF